MWEIVSSKGTALGSRLATQNEDRLSPNLNPLLLHIPRKDQAVETDSEKHLLGEVLSSLHVDKWMHAPRGSGKKIAAISFQHFTMTSIMIPPSLA
jgi:hypothetical protein